MINTRKAGIGLAMLFGVVLAAPVMADAVSDFQAHATRGQQILAQIGQLVDGITQRNGSTAATGDTGTGAVANASETYKCPACGMAMTAAKTGSNSKAVTIKGKTWYCCAGCNMTPYADKKNTSDTPVKNTGKRPGKKKNP